LERVWKAQKPVFGGVIGPMKRKEEKSV